MPNQLSQLVAGEEVVAEYRRTGFVDGGRLLSDDAADELFAAARSSVESIHGTDGAAHDMGMDGRPLLHRKNLWEHHTAFRRLIDDPAIAEGLHLLTGDDRFVLWQDGLFYKPGTVGSEHAWHQDLVYLPLAPTCRGTAVWIALTEVTDGDSGAMVMVPGSHRWGDASAVVEPLGAPSSGSLPLLHHGEVVAAEVCPVRKGLVHFHDGHTWHGSLRNRRPEPRCGVLLFFVHGDVRIDADHPHAHKYPEALRGELDETLHPVITVS